MLGISYSVIAEVEQVTLPFFKFPALFFKSRARVNRVTSYGHKIYRIRFGLTIFFLPGVAGKNGYISPST